MPDCRIKKSFGIFVLLMMAMFFSVSDSSAYSVYTHRAINQYILENNANGFSLDDYLKNQLGIEEGVKYIVGGNWDILGIGSFSLGENSIKNWIIAGGEYEDDWLRMDYHFLNPLTDSGYLGQPITAKVWALLPLGTTDPFNGYSWLNARDYYIKALLATDESTRSNNLGNTFRSLGQVMHLVQDMSVPAWTDKDKTYIPKGASGVTVRLLVEFLRNRAGKPRV